MSTILVVDDRPINRQFLVTLLGYCDHKVLEAGDGGEALETLRCSPVDLVIADVLMPTMDGYEFLRQLRRMIGALGPLPVIFYTAAHYETQARAMAEACGVRHFLTKPAVPEVIIAAVNAALGGNVEHSLASLRKLNRHPLMAPSDPIDSNAIVFVVDDDVDQRHALAMLMNEACLKVATFATAEEFLVDYNAKQAGCLVVDLCLPGMSGIVLLETLRSRRIHIPAIILTGHGDLATAVDAMRLGVVDFLNKPWRTPAS